MTVHHPEHALSPQHALSRPDAETLRLMVQLPAVASMKELEVDLASRAVTVSGASPAKAAALGPNLLSEHLGRELLSGHLAVLPLRDDRLRGGVAWAS